MRQPGPIDNQQATPVLDNINGISTLPAVSGARLIDVKASYDQLLHIKKETNKTTYTLLSRLSFPGTSNLKGIPNTLKMTTAFKAIPSDTASIRLFDTTNSLVIAELTGISTDGLKNLGTLSNLPTGESILEVQAKVINPNDKLIIHSLHLYRA